MHALSGAELRVAFQLDDIVDRWRSAIDRLYTAAIDARAVQSASVDRTE